MSAADKAQWQLITEALDNCITALGQSQKGTARQFLQSAINASIATEREKVKPLMNALIKIANDPNCDRCQVAVNALAKLNESQ